MFPKKAFPINIKTNHISQQTKQILSPTMNPEEPSQEYLCPITHEIMLDPVILITSGHTYERESIEQWLKQNGTDPQTREPISTHQLVPNRSLKSVIESWLKQHPQCDSETWFDASRSDNLKTISRCIKLGADVNAEHYFNETALMYASEKGYTDIVRLLIDNNAYVDAKDGGGMTALMYASREGHVDIVRLLLDKNADVNTFDVGGDGTALVYASRKGHVDIVRLLLDKDAKDDGCMIALMYASEKGYTDIVRLLIDKDTDVNSKDGDGMTALMYASRKGHIDIVRLLVDKDVDVNAEDYVGKTALMYASRRGQVDIVRLLIDKDACVHAKSGGMNALMYASEKGYTDIVRLLIDKDARVNAKDSDGMTALMYASREGHADIVRLLLDKDAEVNANDDGAMTALMYASRKGHIDIVRLLIDNIAMVNVADNNGETALFHAVRNGHIDVGKYLVYMRAFTWLKNNNGKTVSFLDHSQQFQEIYKWPVCKELPVRLLTEQVDRLTIAHINLITREKKLKWQSKEKHDELKEQVQKLTTTLARMTKQMEEKDSELKELRKLIQERAETPEIQPIIPDRIFKNKEVSKLAELAQEQIDQTQRKTTDSKQIDVGKRKMTLKQEKEMLSRMELMATPAKTRHENMKNYFKRMESAKKSSISDIRDIP